MRLMDLSVIRSNLVESKNNLDFLGILNKTKLDGNLPITAREVDWVNENGKLEKTFYFSKPQTMKNFVEKLIVKMEKMYHHCRFSVYEYEVSVSLTTKNVNDITQQDVDLSRYLDYIYFDIEGTDITIDRIG